MFKTLNNHKGKIIIITILTLEFLTFLVFKNNIYIETHDNLDSIIVWLKNMRDYEVFWKQGSIPMLDKLDRNYLPSEFQLENIFFYIFPTLFAYLSVYFIKILLGMFSFYICIKEIFPEKMKRYKEIGLLVAFIFAHLPGCPSLYFAQVTIPLILYLFIKLNKATTSKEKNKYYLLILIYPILSEFTRYGIFILGYLLIYIIFNIIKHKKIKKENIVAWILLTLGYIITEYRLFYIILFSGQKSIRAELDLQRLVVSNYITIIKEILENFINGIYHAQSAHKFLILPLVLFYFIKKLIENKFNFFKLLKNKYILVLIFIVINSIIAGLYYASGVREIVAVLIPPLKGWNFGRTVWFNPFLWYIMFLIVLFEIKKEIIIYILCIIQLIIVLLTPRLYNDFLKTLYYNTVKTTTNALSYQEFYSEKLFEIIKEDIGYSNEKAVAFGFFPSILNFNKIHTLDGYHNAYSLEYKNKFKKIILPELLIDKRNKDYFEAWGGRAYIFSNEIYYDPRKILRKYEANLIIDENEFKKLGGVYIFSRVKIINYQEKKLKFIKKYSNKNSPYIIYLYRVNN